MTTIPHTQKALSNTAQDFRALGEAAKTDLNRLTNDVHQLAKAKVIDPGLQMVTDASHRLEAQARRSADAAKVQIAHLREVIVEHPGRSLVGALAGGIILGLLLRR
ncbi:MAG: hypothetical protein V4662_10445 [Verrucomicrobiota bacterium]